MESSAAIHITSIGYWNIQRKEVVLEWDSWTRYTLHSSKEWAALYPGDGVVHTGPEKAPFTVTMFHQLRCLDVVREQLSKPRTHRDAEPTRHCMNYLRQLSACHVELDFEPNQYVHEINPVHPHPTHRCLDWRPIYEELARNQVDYLQWTADRANLTSDTR